MSTLPAVGCQETCDETVMAVLCDKRSKQIYRANCLCRQAVSCVIRMSSNPFLTLMPTLRKLKKSIVGGIVITFTQGAK